VVLFNIGSVYNKLGQLKTEFWKYSHIGIPDPDTESNDAVVLGFLVAQFIGEVRASLFDQSVSPWLLIIIPALGCTLEMSRPRCHNQLTVAFGQQEKLVFFFHN